MGFMQRQVTVKRKWYEIETNAGTWFVDVDDLDGGKFAESLAGGLELDTWALAQLEKDYLQYTEGSSLEGLSVREGYGARLSAPGYMDCTEWSVFDTEQEANDYLEETYGDGDGDGDGDDDGDDEDESEVEG